MAIFGIIWQIAGFLMILKSEGKISSTSAGVDPQYFRDPVKSITNIGLHEGGILIIVIGLGFQIVSVVL